jgi:hypothetical protein
MTIDAQKSYGGRVFVSTLTGTLGAQKGYGGRVAIWAPFVTPPPPPPPPPPQPIGGGGPGNAQRGRKRAVYMVDGKVFDRAEDAARYLASVTLPEPEEEAQPAPRRAVSVAEVEIEGERLALEPIALPVNATPEFVADMVRGELQAARRKLQRRQEAFEREEMAAVMAAMQLLLDDGEEIVFH